MEDPTEWRHPNRQAAWLPRVTAPLRLHHPQPQAPTRFHEASPRGALPTLLVSPVRPSAPPTLGHFSTAEVRLPQDTVDGVSPSPATLLLEVHGTPSVLRAACLTVSKTNEFSPRFGRKQKLCILDTTDIDLCWLKIHAATSSSAWEGVSKTHSKGLYVLR